MGGESSSGEMTFVTRPGEESLECSRAREKGRASGPWCGGESEGTQEPSQVEPRLDVTLVSAGQGCGMV